MYNHPSSKPPLTFDRLIAYPNASPVHRNVMCYSKGGLFHLVTEPLHWLPSHLVPWHCIALGSLV
jgi:hypothetical protein